MLLSPFFTASLFTLRTSPSASLYAKLSILIFACVQHKSKANPVKYGALENLHKFQLIHDPDNEYQAFLCPQFNSHPLQSMENLLHHCIYFLILQSMILCPEGNGVGHGFISCQNLGSLVDIEEMIALQNLSASLRDHIFNLPY